MYSEIVLHNALRQPIKKKMEGGGGNRINHDNHMDHRYVYLCAKYLPFILLF